MTELFSARELGRPRHRTGFDIESLIFRFALGGLAAAYWRPPRNIRSHFKLEAPLPGQRRRIALYPATLGEIEAIGFRSRLSQTLRPSHFKRLAASGSQFDGMTVALEV